MVLVLEAQIFFAWPSLLSVLPFKFCDVFIGISLGVWMFFGPGDMTFLGAAAGGVCVALKGSLMKVSFGSLEKKVVDFFSWKMLGQFP